MNIFKEPYDPNAYSFNFRFENHPDIKERRIVIHAGKGATFSPGNTFVPLVVLAATGLLAPLAWWAVIVASLAILIAWIAVPSTRPLVQKKRQHYIQDGGSYMGPRINWDLANNPLYQEGIHDWIQELRASDDRSVNKYEWSNCFQRIEKIIDHQNRVETPGPDFTKIQILEELMELE